MCVCVCLILDSHSNPKNPKLHPWCQGGLRRMVEHAQQSNEHGENDDVGQVEPGNRNPSVRHWLSQSTDVHSPSSRWTQPIFSHPSFIEKTPPLYAPEISQICGNCKVPTKPQAWWRQSRVLKTKGFSSKAPTRTSFQEMEIACNTFSRISCK